MLLDEQKNRQVIDCMRAIGIILVICFHVVVGVASLLEGPDLTLYIAAIPPLFNIMWQALGSEIVFLFSGFLLCYLLLHELVNTSRIDLRDFFVRRAARILPLYWIGLLLYSFFSDFGFYDLVLNLLFVSKLFDAETIIPVGWSLEVLTQSFVILPLYVAAVIRSGHPIKITIALIVASLVARYLTLEGDPESYRAPIYALFSGVRTGETVDDLYYHLGYRATPFLLGFLLAYFVTHRESVLLRLFAGHKRAVALTLVALLVIAGSGFLPVQHRLSFVYTDLNEDFWLWFWTLQRFVFAIGICILTLCIWYGKTRVVAPFIWVSGLRWWKSVSDNIYSIYLFHPAFLIPAAAIGFRAISAEGVAPVHWLEVAATMVLATIFSTLFAGVVTRFVEKPTRSWIRTRYGS